MAIYHLHVKTGKVGKGRAHASYICGTDKFERKSGVEFTESGNLPAWANDALDFWSEADARERKNGVVYREIEVALPRELSREQQIELVRALADEVCGDKHAYTWALHVSKASDGKEQPHAHLMFSERIDDGVARGRDQYFKRYNSKAPERGGCKKSREWQATKTQKQKYAVASERLLQIREFWAERVNLALEQAHSSARVDHRSYAARGLARVPQPKVGVKAWHAAKKAAERGVEIANEFLKSRLERFYEWRAGILDRVLDMSTFNTPATATTPPLDLDEAAKALDEALELEQGKNPAPWL